MPNWREITKDNKQHYTNKNHHGKAIVTGELSGITVFDFDIAPSYYEMVEKFPDLKKVKTIKTNKGFHLYFEHDSTILTTVDAFNDYVGIDIRNGKSIVFAPPSRYKLSDGTNFQYQDLGGDILAVPEEIKSKLKQLKKKQKLEKIEMDVEKVENLKSRVMIEL